MRDRSKQAKWCRDRYWEATRLLSELKAVSGCLQCGEAHPDCLDFHHRDAGAKSFTVCKSKRWAWDTLLREVEKCDILCANCHRKLEAQKRRDANGTDAGRSGTVATGSDVGVLYVKEVVV
jgi:hypothetical protein